MGERGPDKNNIAKMASSGEDRFRKVHLNNDTENERLRKELHYAGNRVATSKYTLVR